jgi:hypothetical protein
MRFNYFLWENMLRSMLLRYKLKLSGTFLCDFHLKFCPNPTEHPVLNGYRMNDQTSSHSRLKQGVFFSKTLSAPELTKSPMQRVPKS